MGGGGGGVGSFQVHDGGDGGAVRPVGDVHLSQPPNQRSQTPPRPRLFRRLALVA